MVRAMRWCLPLCLLTACSDLIPDGFGGDIDTRVVDTIIEVGDTTVELPDVPAQSCESDDDCAHLEACCLDVVCQDNVCMPAYVSRCCVVDGPCAVSTSLRSGTCEARCEANGCIESLRLGDTRCNETLWELPLTAEGMRQVTIIDPVPDRVTWHLSRLEPFAGRDALRAGDVLCPTYFTGPLDATCQPVGTEAGVVDVAFVTAPIPIPQEIASQVELWLFADLPTSDGLSTPLDGLELEVISTTQGPFVAWSTRVSPIVTGQWTPVLVDMSLWGGKSVQLRFSFKTLDGRDNDHRGIAIGTLRVRTACAADRTATDRSVCELAYPTPVRGLDDALVVYGPPDPARACEPCTAATTCTRVDTCDVAVCTTGTCQIERELTATCCTPDARWAGDGSFEDPLPTPEEITPEGWITSGPWSVSSLRSLLGERALHFGEPDGSGIAAPGQAAEGTLLSPVVAVPDDAPRWRFSLWLATEWDAAPSSDNPAGLDLLEAVVLAATPVPVAPSIVWDSREVGGTTLGQWVTVTIDLTPWRGREVRLGWRFGTGDADANDAEGVYIDQAVVFRECPGCGAGELLDPACAPELP